MSRLIAIIGAGLVGLSTAWQLLKSNPGCRVVVCEKEEGPARHQSGRNSGVIHSGAYYKIGSLKAKNCVEGRKALLDFCEAFQIPVRRLHKVIVAQDGRQEASLQELEKRCAANGVESARVIGKGELADVEPHVQAKSALYLPLAAIVDFSQVAHILCQEIKRLGGEMEFGNEILACERGTLVGRKTTHRPFLTINCAGLHADRMASLFGRPLPHRIIPFRGEYYFLKEEKRDLVKGLIYPVPDPRFPFLGVHLTPTIHGDVEVGPNAVLAWMREGYRRSDVCWQDVKTLLGYSGFWAMALKYWKAGLYEQMRSLSKRLFVRDVQKLVPALREADFLPGGVGIRAQAVTRSGKLVDDFVIEEDAHAIHVLNAPSPAATSCLSIGAAIRDLAWKKLA